MNASIRIEKIGSKGYVVIPETQELETSRLMSKSIDEAFEEFQDKIIWNQFGYMESKLQAIQYKDNIINKVSTLNIDIRDVGIVNI